MNKPLDAKSRNLLKGAIRRLFSRSTIRQEVIAQSKIEHIDTSRPRVKKWSKCPECKNLTPTYQMEVDHINPVVRLDETLEEMSWDLVVERIWCDIDNLKAICKPCHKLKSKAESKERRRIKREKKQC
jgi:5-methylcytosine-specific restriction endonuclease McrA